MATDSNQTPATAAKKEDGRLTRQELEAVIDRGEAVLVNGKIITRKQDLPKR